MTALDRVIASGRPHGPVAVAFTPDEETGLGIAGFDVEGFGAAYAYTCLLYTSSQAVVDAVNEAFAFLEDR